MRATLFAFLILCGACGGSSTSNTPADSGTAGTADSGPADSGPTGASCVTNPQTNLDLLNACTDAGFIDKKATLPLLQADGGLPPLP